MASTPVLISRGDEWINETTRLAELRKFADDKEFQAKWRAIKLDNKKRLAAKVKVLPSLPFCCLDMPLARSFLSRSETSQKSASFL